MEFHNKEIKVFMIYNAMRDWWNQGLHAKSLSTYCFLVKCNIPDRLGLMQVRSWQATTYEMLRHIPTIQPSGLNVYFDSIDCKHYCYENLKDVPTLFELVIWGSKITEQTYSPSR